MMKNLKIKIFLVLWMLVAVLLSSAQADIITAAATREKPDISIMIDGVKPYPGDPISSTPNVMIMVTTPNTLESIRITLDSIQESLPFLRDNNNYYSSHEVASPLAEGIHGITIEAFDVLSNARTFEVTPLYVQSRADITLQGIPLCYPNPFDPGIQSSKISYILSKPANITLRIFNLAGNLIAKSNYFADQQGGRAGYNEVSWNGKSDNGNYVGNGIYIFLIIADGKVAQNGKGKITVFKR